MSVSDTQVTRPVDGEFAKNDPLPPLDLLEKVEHFQPRTEAEDQVVAIRIAQQFSRRSITAKYIGVIHATRMTTYQYALCDEDFGQIGKIDDTLRQMISMAVEASGVSLQAPVPNSAIIAVHVPSKDSSTSVPLMPFIVAARKDSFRIPLIIGEDYRGKPYVLDLATECHQLVAGQTGSGKSVFLRSLILGIAMSCKPQNVKLILVDGKGLDLPTFGCFPHNACPVITDHCNVLAVLRWMNEELDRRRQLMGSSGKQDIWAHVAHHEMIESGEENNLPAIVLVVDEFQTVISNNGDVEAEQLLQQLTQQGRACGLFVILATQRPSVDILQGSTKTNIPGRICFRLPTQVDSRVVLDRGGAELLAQPGDLLAMESSLGQMARYQAPYASDQEVERVCEFFESSPSQYIEPLCRKLDGKSKPVICTMPLASENSARATSYPEEQLIRPSRFVAVRASKEKLLDKLNRVYPDRKWELNLVYVPYLLGIAGNKSSKHVLFCPATGELITRIVPWTTVPIFQLLKGPENQMEVLSAMRRLPRRAHSQREIVAWLAEHDLPDADLVSLMTIGHLDPDLRPTRSIQCLPVLCKRLQVSLVPEADGCVLPIIATDEEGGSLQLRQVLGTLWQLPVDQVQLVGLPTYHTTTDRGDSLWLIAANPLPWRWKLDDLAIGDVVSV